MVSTAPPVSHTIRRLTFSIYVPTLLSAIARGSALILLPLYALDLDSGAVAVATVVGLRAVGTMISDLPSGHFVAKIGDKAVMLVGLVVLSATAFFTSIFESVLILMTSALLFGVGGGVWILARIAHITESVKIEQRGRVISVMAGLERAGNLVGPALAGFSAEYLGFQATFLGIGVLLLLATALCAVKTQRTWSRTTSRTSINLLQIIVRHRRTFVTGGVVMVALSYLRNARQLIVPLWGVAIGLGPSEIGLVVSLSAAIDLAMFLPAGLILDHIGRKAALIPCMILMSLSVALLPLTTNFWTFLAVSMLSGLGNGFGTGIFVTLGGDLAPRHGRSQFLGMWRLVGDAGGVASPFAIGTIAASTSMLLACSVSGGIGILGVVFATIFIPEPRRTRF